MRFLGLTFFSLSIASFSFAQQEEAPKDVEVKVTFPKQLEVVKKPKTGGETAHFTVKVDITNKGKEKVVFSSANVDVTIKNLGGPPNAASVKKSTDATPIEPGKTLESKREVVIHTVVPEPGSTLEVEFSVYGKKYEGKVAVPKKK